MIQLGCEPHSKMLMERDRERERDRLWPDNYFLLCEQKQKPKSFVENVFVLQIRTNLTGYTFLADIHLDATRRQRVHAFWDLCWWLRNI